MSTKKLQLIGAINANTLDGKHADEFCQINPIYTATPETLEDVISSAQAGSTIQLTEGQYGLLKLVGKNSYPENLTIVGCDGATVAGVSITSGIISDTISSSSDVSDAILPQGLTFKNITFTNNFSQKNSRIDNLTIDGCTFTEKCNIFINPEGFNDSYGNEMYSADGTSDFGFTYRYEYCQVNQENLVIKNCTIADGTTFIDPNGKSVASAIHVLGVKGVTLTYNDIAGGYNGIQVGGAETDYNVVASGEITITKNIVKNTSSRGINVASVHSGEVIIAENTLSNINHKDKIISRYFKDTTINYLINGVYHKLNTCDGENISPILGGVIEQDIIVKTSNYDYKPNTYIVASSSKLTELLPTVEAGATIKLKKANYSLLNLKGNQSYPENLTIIGEDGATFAGITITSGVRPEDGIDMDLVVMPKGLTLKNLTFTDKLNVINSDISNLSVIDCHFNENAFINCRASAFDAGGTRKGANETMSHNVLVKGCTFEASTSRQYGVYMQATDSAVFEDNTIDGATINGIFVTGIYANDKWSCGKFIVRNNTISNTTSEGIKFLCLKDASVYAMNNTLSSTSEVKGILASNCFGVTISEDGNTLNSEALVIAQSSVSSPADYIKSQIGLAAALKEKADKTDLDSKMDEGVLIYNGINDTDETGLNNWLDNIVMPTMANDTIRNISVRVGGAKGDGKGIIPWASLGTIHKRTDAYATIDVTAQINGKHYTKYRTDGKWSAVACIEDKISLKADKAAVDAALANKADKSELNGFASQADLDTKMDSLPLVYNYLTEDGSVKPFESDVEYWLDNEVLPNMENNEIKNISIECPVYYVDRGVGPMFGTICKNGNDAYLNLTSAVCPNITKAKTSGRWNSFVLSSESFEDKIDSKPREYVSTTDTDETNLNSWLSNISNNIFNSRPWEPLGDKDTILFVSITTPAVAEGKTLIGTFYVGYHVVGSEMRYPCILTLVNSETGEQYVKIYKNGAWEKIKEFNEDNSYITEEYFNEWASNYNAALMGRVDHNTFNFEMKYKMEYKPDIFYESSATDETKLNVWLDDILSKTQNRTEDGRMVSHVFISTPAIDSGARLMGSIYADYGNAVVELTAQRTGNHYIKVKSNDVWQNTVKVESSGGITEEYLNEYLDEYDRSVLKRTYLNSDAFSHAHSDKLDCFPQIFTEKTSTDETKLNTWLSNLADTLNSWSGGNRGIQNVYISTPSVASGQTLMGLMFLDGNNNATVNLTAVGTDERYIKVRQNGVWQNTAKVEAISGEGITEERLQEAMSSFDQVDNTSDLDKPISTATQAALDAKANKSLVSYYSDNDADETNFNAWLNARLSEMAPGSFLGIKVNCYPAINGVTLFGMLYKHDATNLYATLTLSTYAAGTYKKIKTNGNWLATAALSDVAFTFKNGTLEIKTTF